MGDAPRPKRAAAARGVCQRRDAEHRARIDDGSDGERNPDDADVDGAFNPISHPSDESDGLESSDVSDASDGSDDSDVSASWPGTKKPKAAKTAKKARSAREGFGSGLHDRQRQSERSALSEKVRQDALDDYHRWRKDKDVCPASLGKALGLFEDKFAGESELAIARQLRWGHLARSFHGLRTLLGETSSVPRLILGPSVDGPDAAAAVLRELGLCLRTMATLHRVVYVESHYRQTRKCKTVSRHALLLLSKHPGADAPADAAPSMHVVDENGHDSHHVQRVARLLGDLTVAHTEPVHGIQRATELYISGQNLGKHMGWCALWATSVIYLVDRHGATYDDVMHLLGGRDTTSVQRSMVVVRRITTEIYNRTLAFYKAMADKDVPYLIRERYTGLGNSFDVINVADDDGDRPKVIRTTIFNDQRRLNVYLDDDDAGGTLWVGGGEPRRAPTDAEHAARHADRLVGTSFAAGGPRKPPCDRSFEHVLTGERWRVPKRVLPDEGLPDRARRTPCGLLYVIAQIVMPTAAASLAALAPPVKTIIVHLPVQYSLDEDPSEATCELASLRDQLQRILCLVWPSAGQIPAMEQWAMTLCEYRCERALHALTGTAPTGFAISGSSPHWLLAPWPWSVGDGPWPVHGAGPPRVWRMRTFAASYEEYCACPNAKFEFSWDKLLFTCSDVVPCGLGNRDERRLHKPRKQIGDGGLHASYAYYRDVAVAKQLDPSGQRARVPLHGMSLRNLVACDTLLGYLQRELRVVMDINRKRTINVWYEHGPLPPRPGHEGVTKAALASLRGLRNPVTAVWVGLRVDGHAEHILAIVHPAVLNALPSQSCAPHFQHARRRRRKSRDDDDDDGCWVGICGGPTTGDKAYVEQLASLLLKSSSATCDAIAPVHADPSLGKHDSKTVTAYVRIGCYQGLDSNDWKAECELAESPVRTNASCAPAKCNLTYTVTLTRAKVSSRVQIMRPLAVFIHAKIGKWFPAGSMDGVA